MAWWILQHLAITAALAAAVAAACRWTRLGPVARHALWLIVLVKFVTPPLLVWPWAVPDVLGVLALEAPSRPSDPYPSPPTTLASLPLATSSERSTTDHLVRGTQRTVRAPMDVVAKMAPWALAVWIAGSVFVLAVEVARMTRLARRVRAAPPPEASIANRVVELAAAVGVAPVDVVRVDAVPAPAIWCLRRPVLLWPGSMPQDASPAAVDGLIVHELAHVKRGDHVVGWLELAGGVIWWWNPLFWIARSSLREQAELACDAWVIATLPSGRRAYAESLLAFSAPVANRLPTPSLAVIGIHATRRRVLERRLVMIMKGRVPLRLSMGGLVAVALFGAATLPAWAVGARQQPPPPPAAAPQLTSPPPQAPTPPPPMATSRSQKPTPPPPPPAPPAADKHVQAPAPPKIVYVGPRPESLPADVRQIVEGFDKEREAIQKEADDRIAARREAAIKTLQTLQEEYAKAGKLDEAIAVRDYLRAGGPVQPSLVKVYRSR